MTRWFHVAFDLFCAADCRHSRYRHNSRRDRGETGPSKQCIGPPNFLAVVFKKQEISQQVVTRMQDLASEFAKIFRGYPHSGRGAPLSHSTPSPALGLGAGCKCPRLGTQTLVPLHFSSSSTNFIATQVLNKTSGPLCVTCTTAVVSAVVAPLTVGTEQLCMPQLLDG